MRRSRLGTAWAVTLPVVLGCLCAPLFGVGVNRLLVASAPWEGLSVMLLAGALLLLAVGTRREALGRPVGGILRAATADLGLAALAVHYLLA